MTNLPVIVAIDGSPSAKEALEWAAQEASAHHAPLHIVTSCVDPLQVGTPPMEFEPMRSESRKLLAEASATAKAIGDIEVKTILSESWPTPTLIDLSQNARMVVTGSRGHGAFRRGLLGSVATSVARHAHCPVAVIHERDVVDPAELRQVVVVGVDGTRNSERAIEIAFDEASHRGLDLVAVHAWLDYSGYDVPMDWQAEAEGAERALAESLAGWQEKYPDVAVQRIVVKDRAARHLVAEADDAALVVVGSHGRGGFSGMLLGSTSQAVLHSVTCPLIIARESA